MNLDEITLTKQFKGLKDEPTLAPQLKQILNRHGWKSLGIGWEAAVAMHPAKAYVLKIFPASSKYKHFVEFVQTQQQNPHLPKFSRYIQPVPGTHFLYVRMEKLSRVNEQGLLTRYLPYLLVMAAIGQHSGIQTLSDNLKYYVRDNIENWGFDFSDMSDSQHADDIYQRAGGYPPETWFEVVDRLAKQSQDLGITRWDMHEENFMRRGNTLVIADPYF